MKPNYTYEVEEYRAAVSRIRLRYTSSPQLAHAAEDNLMERFVRDVAWGKQTKETMVEHAGVLCDLLDLDRKKWFG